MTSSNATQPTEAPPDRSHRARLWVNWLFALSTILGAAAVQLFAMGAVMSTAACSTPDCPKPSGFVYGLLTYGAPVIAVAALTDTAVQIVVRPWVKNGDYWDLFFALQERVSLAFEAEGFKRPLPQVAMHVPKA